VRIDPIRLGFDTCYLLRDRGTILIDADDIAAVRRSWTRLREMGARTIYPAQGKPFPIAGLDRQLA
jgi:hypothetical protein